MTPSVKGARDGSLLEQEHWDSRWDSGPQPPIRLLNYYHFWLDRFLRPFLRSGARILEVGGGGSAWLPFFIDRYQVEGWCIDYSASGIRATQHSLERAGVEGVLVEGDLFDLPADVPKEGFQLVYSLGVIEHFKDPETALAAMCRLLASEGVMVTLVPNMSGVIGWLHRKADPDLYLSHVVFTPEMLDVAHGAAGLESVVPAEYLGSMSIAVVNYDRLLAGMPRQLRHLVLLAARVLQQLLMLPLRLLHLRVESKQFSPYVVGAYRRRDERA